MKMEKVVKSISIVMMVAITLFSCIASNNATGSISASVDYQTFYDDLMMIYCPMVPG